MNAERRPPSCLVPIDFSIVGAPVDASATMESADDGLSKLNLSDKTKVAMLTSPEAQLRGQMLGALDLQIEAAEAMLKGEIFIRRAMRWLDDPETGERVRIEYRRFSR